MQTARNPLKGWQVDRSAIRLVGKDLQRPECVLADPDGTLWSADARGGVMRINPDGSQQVISQQQDARFASSDNSADKYIFQGTLPNGICFAKDGSFLIANFGTDAIELMAPDGSSKTLYDKIDGQPLGKTNFVLRDSKNRIWFTVTTRSVPWTKSINEKIADGYVGLIDENGIRIVADGFVGTNEIRFDAKEEWLYVVESNARCISRLRVQPDGSLTHREVYGPSRLSGIPDGFAFDSFGNLWITLVLHDKIIALTPDGEELLLLDDSDPAKVAAFDKHFWAGTVTPEIMTDCQGTLAPWMASVTFGGPDLKTVYIGSLRGTTLPSFQSPVAGLPMIHWEERRRK